MATLPPISGVRNSLLPQEELDRRLAAVRLFLCDVDGVLTDGTVSLGEQGETKRFSIHDGLGLRFLRESGIPVGWVSNRPSAATTARARELGIEMLSQQRGGKVAEVEVMLREAGVGWESLCYMGDDVVDLGVLRRAGVAVAPANATDAARSVAHWITGRRGGEGAVREVVERILTAKGIWNGILEKYGA